MKLSVLGSSSKGNCYLIHSPDEALIIETGIRLSEVKKTLNFKINHIRGVLVSHSHGDHSKYCREYAQAGLKVLAPVDVFLAPHNNYRPVQPGKGYTLGRFQVIPFQVEHDVPCYGYIVNHPDTGKIVFLTDTYLSKYTFKDVNHFLVEANYCDEILDENISKGRVHPSQKQRLFMTHMELKTTKELLKANDLSQTRTIVLIHLSDGNSHQDRFISEIKDLTGKPVYAADNGFEIDLTMF